MVQQAKGLGYAINTSEEINFVKEIAATTGIVLDPVYRSVTVLVSTLLLPKFMSVLYISNQQF